MRFLQGKGGIWATGTSEEAAAPPPAPAHAPDPVRAEATAIAEASLFDVTWFRERHPDAAGDDALAVIAWQIAHRPLERPHPLFDVAHYTATNPGWEAQARTPLGHYVRHGARAGASPHPLFDPAWYAAQCPDLPPEALLRDFLERGHAEGRSPHPAFQPDWYFRQQPQLRSGRVNPLTHYVEVGWQNGLTPNRLFATGWFVVTHPDPAGREPLGRFLGEGIAAGQAPHPAIDLAAHAGPEADAAARRAAYLRLLEAGEAAIPDAALEAALQNAGPRAAPPPPAAPTPRPPYDLEALGTAFGPDDLPPPLEPHPLPAALLPAIAEAQHVSFDVWDTLLRRDCDPDEVKLQSARCLLLSGRRWLRAPELGPAAMLTLRQEAEAAVADAQWEYRFEAALDHWLGTALRPDTPAPVVAALRARLLAHEAQVEARVTRPDRHAAALLDAADGRASLLSDFYCGLGFVRQVLDGHALDRGFVSAHVSCEVGRTKRHGGLYDDLLAATGQAPAAVLHIGDNAEADIARARERGLGAFHYEVEVEAARKRWFAEAFHAYRRGDTAPHARRILALLEAEAAGAADPAFAAGIRLAPLAFGLALSAGEAAYAAGADKVWFFTREGVFLRQVYEAIRAADPYHCPLPEGRVLEVSRLATFAPSLAALDVPSLMRLWTLYSSQSLAALCASLNLPAAAAQRFGPRHGIVPEATIRYPFEDARVAALLADPEFQQAAAMSIDPQRALLRRYLDEQGFAQGGAPAHCVDIGWRGTIQDNLALLTGQPTVGHYLGLFGFLNPQPDGAAKHGYLGDANRPDRPFELAEVAGLEMLFTQPGGSVTGYAEAAGRVVARRQTFAGEEALLAGRMAPVQAGMLAAVPLLAGYLGRHGLVAGDLAGLATDLAQSLVLHPPAPIAEAFAAHEHNETFGLGEALRFSATELAPLAGLRQGAVLAAGRAAAAGWRWPQALLRTQGTAAALASLDAAQRAALPAAFNLARGPALVRSLGDTLAIYAPPPLRGSGGHRTLFNLGRRMSALGWRLSVYLEGTGDGMHIAEGFLGDTPARLEPRWPQGVSSTLALATVAYSARFVAQVPQAPHKAYLVQDLEAMFEAMGDGYLWNEESYTFGLRHITIGHWLTHLLRDRYRAEAAPAGLGCDTALYRPRPEIPREDAVCFLYQPEKPRRAPRHAIEALRLVKQRLPGTKIYLYGSPHRAELDFDCEQLGLIDDLEQLATLYARCRVGLCLSSSNPSRIPYEMMAAGCVPVDLYRANNLLDHTTGTLRLAYQAADSLSVAMETLLTDPADWQRRSAAGIAAAATRSLDWELEAAANHLFDLVRGRPLAPDWPFPPPYAEAPVVGELDDRPSVHGFLDHQRASLGPLWRGFGR